MPSPPGAARFSPRLVSAGCEWEIEPSRGAATRFMTPTQQSLMLVSLRRLRSVIHAIALLSLFAALPSSVARGIDPKQVAEAQALIDRAERLSRLAQSGSSPFFFQARIDHTPSRLTGKGGIYKVWWVADDKWREVAESGDLKAFQIRNERGLWMPAEPNLKLEAIFAEGQGYPFRGKLVGWDEKITGLRDRTVDAMTLSCGRSKNQGAGGNSASISAPVF